MNVLVLFDYYKFQLYYSLVGFLIGVSVFFSFGVGLRSWITAVVGLGSGVLPLALAGELWSCHNLQQDKREKKVTNISTPFSRLLLYYSVSLICAIGSLFLLVGACFSG